MLQKAILYVDDEIVYISKPWQEAEWYGCLEAAPREAGR